MVAETNGRPRRGIHERLLRSIRREILDMKDRIDWMMDPPPKPDPKKKPPPPLPEEPPPVPRCKEIPWKVLKKVRAEVWETGRQARDQGQPKSANHYRDTRGGYRNAWFGGWDERERELTKNRGPKKAPGA